jgi:hypothetical protein
VRKITIAQENGLIEIADEDNTSLEECIKELSKIFSAQNVVLLESSETSVLLRPSKVLWISIKNVKPKQEEDIVTDEEI